MTHSSIAKAAARRLVVALLLILGASGLAQAKEPGEQPMGWSKTRIANSPIKPIYTSEIDKDIRAVQVKVDEMAQTVKEANVNPEADSVEQALPGAISLERHKADIAGIEDKFSLCTAAMRHQIQDAEASGKATKADRAQFQKCITHCNGILKTIHDMHYNTSVMLTATKKVYFLNGWEKHKKLMAQLQDQMKGCPMMMKETLACCAALQDADRSTMKPDAMGHDRGAAPATKADQKK